MKSKSSDPKPSESPIHKPSDHQFDRRNFARVERELHATQRKLDQLFIEIENMKKLYK